MKFGLSSSPILAEAKDSYDSTVDSEEAVSAESESTSSFRIICSSSISEASDPDPPNRSLLIADFAVSTNHSSSGSALMRRLHLLVTSTEQRKDKKIVSTVIGIVPWVYASSRKGPDCSSNYGRCNLVYMTRWVARKTCNFNGKVHIKNELPREDKMRA